MSTSVQIVLDRALARSISNRGRSIVSSDAEVVFRVQTAEYALFQRLAADGRTFRLSQALATSTASAAGEARQAQFATALRVVRVQRTADNVPLAFVDPRDPEAEWGPRAIVGAGGASGVVLTEVGASWDEGAPGGVGLLAWVCAAPTPLTALTSNVSTPDPFCDLLDNRLAYYFAGKDVGRDAAELQDYDAEYEMRYKEFCAYIDLLSGLEARAQTRPAPEKKP